jgi:hypothetical protein
MFGQKYQWNASYDKALEYNAFKHIIIMHALVVGKARKRKACNGNACKRKSCKGKAWQYIYNGRKCKGNPYKGRSCNDKTCKGNAYKGKECKARHVRVMLLN